MHNFGANTCFMCIKYLCLCTFLGWYQFHVYECHGCSKIIVFLASVFGVWHCDGLPTESQISQCHSITILLLLAFLYLLFILCDRSPESRWFHNGTHTSSFAQVFYQLWSWLPRTWRIILRQFSRNGATVFSVFIIVPTNIQHTCIYFCHGKIIANSPRRWANSPSEGYVLFVEPFLSKYYILFL